MKRLGLAVVMAMMVGCGGGGGGGGDAGGGGGDTGNAAAMRGMTVAVNAGCNQASICHGANYAGGTTMPTGLMSIPGNITSDMATGIGGWTDAQIEAAVRTGLRRDGTHLCADMLMFDTAAISASEMSDLIAFLRTVPAVTNNVPQSSCR
jgi:hypothetical protein